MCRQVLATTAALPTSPLCRCMPGVASPLQLQRPLLSDTRFSPHTSWQVAMW